MNDVLDVIPLANHSSSSQQWILQAMHQMKEQDDERILYGNSITGTCNGYAAMFILAFLQEDRNSDGHLKGFEWFKKLIGRLGVIAPEIIADHINALYRKRLSIIEQITADIVFANLLERQEFIDHSLQEHLTEDELLDLDLPALFDGIELFQQLHKHDELHEGQINAQVIEPLFPLLAFSSHEQLGGICFVKDFLGVFMEKKAKNKDELYLYISLLKQEMTGLTYPITMQLVSNGHAIAIAYDPQKQYWVFCDINRGINNLIITYDDHELTQFIHDGFYKSFIHQLDELPMQKNGYQKQYILIKQKLYYVDENNHCTKLIPQQFNKEYFYQKLADIRSLMGDDKRSALSYNTIQDIKSHCRYYGDNGLIMNTSFYVTEVNHKSLQSCLKVLERRPQMKSLMALTDEKCYVKNANGKRVNQLTRPHDSDNIQFKLGRTHLLVDFERQLQQLKQKKYGFFDLRKKVNFIHINFMSEVLREYALINAGNYNHKISDNNLKKSIIICCERFNFDHKYMADIFKNKSSKIAVLIEEILQQETLMAHGVAIFDLPGKIFS